MMRKIVLIQKFRFAIACTVRSLAQHGILVTLNKIHQRLTKLFIKLTYGKNDSEYWYRKEKEKRYFNLISKNLNEDDACLPFYQIFKQEKISKGIVIYLLSYNMAIKQRPEHILRHLARQGYLCIILDLYAYPKKVEKLDERLYFTSHSEAAIKYFSDRGIVVYLSNPLWQYFLNYFKQKTVIYDVLDDVSLFHHYGRKLQADHELLLKLSDITLFSSSVLLHRYAKLSKNPLLLKNGVELADFTGIVPSKLYRWIVRDKNSIVVGYHGAITELLDFEILESIATLPQVQLVLIGPVDCFNVMKKHYVNQRIEKLKKYKNVSILGLVAYENLKYYLREFDVGIIPFVINEATDAVWPLKLLEYMALNKSIVVTPIKTLQKFKNAIYVVEPNQFAEKIQELVQSDLCSINYEKILHKFTWEELIKPLSARLQIFENYWLPETVYINKQQSDISVDILNINFYDGNGKVLYKGGAERYVYDLATLCKKLNLSVRILQCANHYFEREYHGIKIIGVPLPKKSQSIIPQDIFARMSKQYRKFCKEADILIASPLELACELDYRKKIIGINHGIHWDSLHNGLANYSETAFKNIFQSLERMEQAVCVDTNFINWLRTYDYELANKTKYIPNYFDPEQFKYTPKNFYNNELIFVFPRRLYKARGIYLTMKAFEYLLPRYSNIKLLLIGQAVPEDAVIFQEFVNRFPGQVTWTEYDMTDMHQAYLHSHVVLIPTLHSEGTSLSCIEAMAMNNAIIATNIGGLPNLIMNNYNGLLISPTVESLIEAAESLILNRSMTENLAKNALKIAQTFTKAAWEDNWRKILIEGSQESFSNVISMQPQLTLQLQH